MVLEKGKIVESGKHRDLLQRDGLYARLVRQQFGADPHPDPSAAPLRPI